MPEPVRVGLVGLGIWGSNHAAAYGDDPRCELAVVCDKNETLAKEMGARCGVPWVSSIEALLDRDVDAVSVATPDFAHVDVVTEVLRRRKHVFVEKPLATSLADAQTLARLAAGQGVVAMVDFQNRWNPAFLAIRQTLEDSSLGKPLTGYVRLSDAIEVATEWLPWAGKSGPEWFLMSHSIDLASWLIGQEAQSVYAWGRRGLLSARGIDCWDTIQAMVRFETCAITFESSWVVPNGSPSVVDALFNLSLEGGTINYEWGYNGLASTTDRVRYPWVAAGPDHYGRLTSFIYEPMRSFITAVLAGHAIESTFEDGLANVRVITAIRQSLETGAPVEIAETR